MDEKADNEVSKLTDLVTKVLVSAEDVNGSDPLKMSDFMGNYLIAQDSLLKDKVTYSPVVDVDAFDVLTITNILQSASPIFSQDKTLIPDFNALPIDVRKKLKTGEYKLGESRQVEDALRAVIVDKNGTRVKDVVLKEVVSSPDVLQIKMQLVNQAQLAQIYNKLESIESLVSFDIRGRRDQDLVRPFLQARTYIREAGCSQTKEEFFQCLNKADDALVNGLTSLEVCLNETDRKELASALRFSFRRGKKVNEILGYLSEDVQLSFKYVGLRLCVLDMLGNKDKQRILIDSFQRQLVRFVKEPINGKEYSPAMLLHLYAKYDDENMNAWSNFSHQIEEGLVPLLESYSRDDASQLSESIYLVSLEDGVYEYPEEMS